MHMHNLKLIRGDDSSFALTVSQNNAPFDLSGVSKIDLHAKTGGKTVLELSSADGSIEMIDGKIILHFRHAATAGAKWVKAVYDLQIVQRGKIKTIMHGTIELIHDITETSYD